jgi:hypothetical protein
MVTIPDIWSSSDMTDPAGRARREAIRAEYAAEEAEAAHHERAAAKDARFDHRGDHPAVAPEAGADGSGGR